MNGWIVDTGAVFDASRRTTVQRLMPVVRQKGLRVVLPQHVLFELARQEHRWCRPLDPPAAVHADLLAELAGVEILTFTESDARALLAWLPGKTPYEETKLLKALKDGWRPASEAFHGHLCMACHQQAWDKNDRGQLNLVANGHARTLAGRHHASATIDWLTVAMAIHHDLQAVTNDKSGPEWAELDRIEVADLAARVAAAT